MEVFVFLNQASVGVFATVEKEPPRRTAQLLALPTEAPMEQIFSIFVDSPKILRWFWR